MTATRTRRPVSTHYYQHDPDSRRCRAQGLGGRLCNLPEVNARHHVRAIDPAITAAEARKLGEVGRD